VPQESVLRDLADAQREEPGRNVKGLVTHYMSIEAQGMKLEAESAEA